MADVVVSVTCAWVILTFAVVVVIGKKYLRGFSANKTKSISKIQFQLLPFSKPEMKVIQFSICHYDYIRI